MRRLFLPAVLAATVFGSLSYNQQNERPSSAIGIGDAAALEAVFDRWQAARAQPGVEETLILSLGTVKGLSQRPAKARGRISLNLRDGTLQAEVSGADPARPLDLWLVDNQPGPGRSVRPEPGDGLIHLGRFNPTGQGATLERRLDPADVDGFEIDLAVVAPSGRLPHDGGLLFGAPSLFQKLHFGGARGGPGAPGAALAGIFRGLVPRAHAADGSDHVSLATLVAEGEELFFFETFEGNGRTCGTCHPAENNFTIDPDFIETLPDDDPLFVAETNPALAEHFEKPKLMRKHGLIVENVDGFDDLEKKFVLRGVPHTLALPTSMGVAPTQPFPAEATGWSADGAPGGGSLREFAIGAVTQHFPQTLARVAGVDFRLPTDRELDAMEAFQLSLGRQEDADLGLLNPRDPDAAAGKVLFLGQGFCNFCHLNGGGNFILTPGVNRNFDTDTEDLVKTKERPHRPVDGGFGTGPGTTAVGFGDGQFNTPTVIEAADTPPFFHNNTAKTLEEAIDFYTTETFSNSPIAQQLGGLTIQLNSAEVGQVGAFLRVLNALENVRAASALVDRAGSGSVESAAALLLLAAGEANDASGVLLEAMDGDGIHRADAVKHLIAASKLLLRASKARRDRHRDALTAEAQAELAAARAAMTT